MNKQSGFTLIELIMVIVILGILAATAIPRYMDLESSAEAAALDGVHGAVQAAVAIQYASVQAGAGGAALVTCTQGSVDGALAGGLPSGYTVAASGSDCTLTQTSTSNTRTFAIL